MKGIGILLIVWGGIGILMGSVMFGDIGLACMEGAVAAILCGIGFLQAESRFRLLWKNSRPVDASPRHGDDAPQR